MRSGALTEVLLLGKNLDEGRYAHRLGELFRTLDNAEKESMAREKKAREKMLALPEGKGEEEKEKQKQMSIRFDKVRWSRTGRSTRILLKDLSLKLNETNTY